MSYRHQLFFTDSSFLYIISAEQVIDVQENVQGSPSEEITKVIAIPQLDLTQEDKLESDRDISRMTSSVHGEQLECPP